uniref:Uncharacterized protein n=1 Tax=Anguilla anguilla TaxID=7936 RepID=A0A0E9XXU3_ANGAN
MLTIVLLKAIFINFNLILGLKHTCMRHGLQGMCYKEVLAKTRRRALPPVYLEELATSVRLLHSTQIHLIWT